MSAYGDNAFIYNINNNHNENLHLCLHLRSPNEGEYLDVHFPPWNHNSTSAEFTLISELRRMKYLSGGTTLRGPLIPKTMKPKVSPSTPCYLVPSFARSSQAPRRSAFTLLLAERVCLGGAAEWEL